MIVRLLRVFTAGVIFVFATGVQAQGQDPSPWYVGLGAGPAWSSGLSVTGAITGTVNSKQPGFNVSGAFGRYVDDIRVIRLEAEVLYNRNDISNISNTAADGNLSSVSLMFNAFYDFNTDSNWTPYIGGGIGYARVAFDDLSVGGTTLIDDSGDTFAWQFKAGVSYQFNPSISISANYRLYGTDNITFKDPANATVNSEGALNQGAELGVRFHF
jgi:opacity protein-like surface antigen